MKSWPVPDVAGDTRRSFLQQATFRLRLAGVREPRREALWLAEAAWHRSPAELLVDGERPVESPDGQAFEALVARRAAGEPLAYVTGTTGFRHLTLACDSRALIPRPETEMLVDLVLERVSTGVAADIGTGTGCVALSLAHEGSFDRVLAVDLGAGPLALASDNAIRCGVTVDYVRGDLAGMLGPSSIDALVANPPYLTGTEYRRLDPSVADWEPAAALVSGADGLGATRPLVEQGWSALRAGGWLVLEVDTGRARHVAELVGACGFANIGVFEDLFERERYVVAQKENVT